MWEIHLINSYAGKACTKTGNKPGVTKGKQWIRLNKTTELLDTPGILWPNLKTSLWPETSLIGSIRDEILNIDELAISLITFLSAEYKGILAERYGIEEEGTPLAMLEAIAEKRGCLLKGKRPGLQQGCRNPHR